MTDRQLTLFEQARYDIPAPWTAAGTCAACGGSRTAEGHDPCIASLPGVLFACCGHGVGGAYLMIENRETLSGATAFERMRALGGCPPERIS